VSSGNVAGFDKLDQLEVAIVGLVRNCAKTVRKDVLRLKKATSKFKAVHFLLIESDSTDNTQSILEALSHEIQHFRSISLGDLTSKHPKRTERIAICRNAYIDEIQSNPGYAHISYVLVADMDGVNTAINENYLLTCWKPGLPEWDACMANQSGAYYDIWALRHPDWCPNDCLILYRKLIPLLGEAQALELAVHSKMVRLKTDHDLIQVESAFGGLGIYKREALLSGRYIGLTESGEEICEHVSFHELLRNAGYKIYINPGMINAAITEHSSRKGALAKFKVNVLCQTPRFINRLLLFFLNDEGKVKRCKQILRRTIFLD